MNELSTHYSMLTIVLYIDCYWGGAGENGEAAEAAAPRSRSTWEWLYCLLRDTYDDEALDDRDFGRHTLLGAPVYCLMM